MGRHGEDRHHHSRSRDSRDRHDSHHHNHMSSDHSRSDYRERSRDYSVSATNPVETSNSKWNDPRSSVDRDRTGVVQNKNPSNVLYLRNLHYEVTEAMIWEALKDDRVKTVRLVFDKEKGRNRGYAFCSFPSIVDASNVITKYPSSSGFGTGPAFVLFGQSCTIEYASKEQRQDRKTDWVCKQCYGINSYRHSECKGCKNPRSESSLDVDRALFEFNKTPTIFVLIKCLCLSATETDIILSFNNCSPTKSAYIFRDSYSKLSRGYGVVEFETIEGAIQTVNMQGYMSVHGYQVTIGYANPYCIREIQHSMVHPQPSMGSVSQPVSYYMSTYSYPSYLPYQTILLPSYQESQTIQQTLLDKTTQPQYSSQNEVLVAKDQKLPDGRSFPPSFQPEIYSLDSASGYYFEPNSQFFYCSIQQMYLDSITSTYYTRKDDHLIPFIPPPPAKPYQVPPKPSVEPTKEEKVPLIVTSTNFIFAPTTNQTSTPIPAKLDIKFTTPLDILLPPQPDEPQSNRVSTQVEGEQLRPGQAITMEVKTKVLQKRVEKKEEAFIPSLVQIERISGHTKKGAPACYICGRRFRDETQFNRHITESRLHRRQLHEWEKYHKDPSMDYKDRAEERRRKVGSTAISNPNKPAVQPVSYSSGPPTTESTIPGFVEPPSVVPTAAPGPSIGQMLLAKDGWLKKHQEEDSSVPLSGTVGFRRGGLGFDSRETQRSEIMKKTLDRLNKLLYVLKKQMKC